MKHMTRKATRHVSQNEGLIFRFRDLLLAGAIDFAQPNVVIGGGFTQCAKIAGLAAAFNVPIANGGAWGFHNMHLQAGVANGTLVEHHHLAVELCRQIYRDLPMPVSIGREEGNVLRLNDERVSRFHAKVQLDGNDVILTDLESTNGLRVNGDPVQIRRLQAGDTEGALACIEDMLRMAPDQAELWRQAAALNQRLDRVAAAVRCLERCLLLVPGEAGTRIRALMEGLRGRLN